MTAPGSVFEELRKVEAEIARLEGLIAGDGGGNLAGRRMLGWAREHRGRVLSLLRAYGVTEPRP